MERRTGLCIDNHISNVVFDKTAEFEGIDIVAVEVETEVESEIDVLRTGLSLGCGAVNHRHNVLDVVGNVDEIGFFEFGQGFGVVGIRKGNIKAYAEFDRDVDTREGVESDAERQLVVEVRVLPREEESAFGVVEVEHTEVYILTGECGHETGDERGIDENIDAIPVVVPVFAVSVDGGASEDDALHYHIDIVENAEFAVRRRECRAFSVNAEESEDEVETDGESGTAKVAEVNVEVAVHKVNAYLGFVLLPLVHDELHADFECGEYGVEVEVEVVEVRVQNGIESEFFKVDCAEYLENDVIVERVVQVNVETESFDECVDDILESAFFDSADGVLDCVKAEDRVDKVVEFDRIFDIQAVGILYVSAVRSTLGVAFGIRIKFRRFFIDEGEGRVQTVFEYEFEGEGHDLAVTILVEAVLRLFAGVSVISGTFRVSSVFVQRIYAILINIRVRGIEVIRIAFGLLFVGEDSVVARVLRLFECVFDGFADGCKLFARGDARMLDVYAEVEERAFDFDCYLNVFKVDIRTDFKTEVGQTIEGFANVSGGSFFGNKVNDERNKSENNFLADDQRDMLVCNAENDFERVLCRHSFFARRKCFGLGIGFRTEQALNHIHEIFEKESILDENVFIGQDTHIDHYGVFIEVDAEYIFVLDEISEFESDFGFVRILEIEVCAEIKFRIEDYILFDFDTRGEHEVCYERGYEVVDGKFVVGLILRVEQFEFEFERKFNRDNVEVIFADIICRFDGIVLAFDGVCIRETDAYSAEGKTYVERIDTDCNVEFVRVEAETDITAQRIECDKVRRKVRGAVVTAFAFDVGYAFVRAYYSIETRARVRTRFGYTKKFIVIYNFIVAVFLFHVTAVYECVSDAVVIFFREEVSCFASVIAGGGGIILTADFFKSFADISADFLCGEFAIRHIGTDEFDDGRDKSGCKVYRDAFAVCVESAESTADDIHDGAENITAALFGFFLFVCRRKCCGFRFAIVGRTADESAEVEICDCNMDVVNYVHIAVDIKGAGRNTRGFGRIVAKESYRKRASGRAVCDCGFVVNTAINLNRYIGVREDVVYIEQFLRVESEFRRDTEAEIFGYVVRNIEGYHKSFEESRNAVAERIFGKEQGHPIADRPTVRIAVCGEVDGAGEFEIDLFEAYLDIAVLVVAENADKSIGVISARGKACERIVGI